MFSTSYALGVNCVKNLSLTRVVWCGVVWCSVVGCVVAAVPSLCISLMRFR